MGMNYNITFYDAVIPPENYAALLHRERGIYTPEQEAVEAREHVRAMLTDATLEQDENGIIINGCGFYESAGYSYGEDLVELLSYCRPGAYAHEIDAEESSGDQWRHILQADGTVRTVMPVITWPDAEAE